MSTSGAQAMRVVKLTIAYDGTEFAGWQVQPHERTVQETLERAIQQVTGHRTRAVASGRTDAGVHALGQVVSFTTNSQLPADVLCRALNANTPADLVVREVVDAPPRFHALRDARGKRYRYVIHDSPLPDVFARHYAWHIPKRLDGEAMAEAARPLVGRHDFASFQASGSPRASTVRTVRQLTIQRQAPWGCEKLVLEIAADGFLYNMVRNIVGTLVEVGRGSQPVDWPARVLEARDRRQAGPTAPAHGLFLVSVDYGREGETE